MNDPRSNRFFFDYVDPLSYLVEIELRRAEEQLDFRAVRVPFELRPPPMPMLRPDAPEWSARWERAARCAEPSGVDLRPLRLVPWTRKAHELALYAGEHGLASEAHDLLFERTLLDGADIGRIDVLVHLAVELGLDGSETKASLDVDRHTDGIVRARSEGIEAGVLAPPALVGRDGALEGFHSTTEIVKLFRSQ